MMYEAARSVYRCWDTPRTRNNEAQMDGSECVRDFHELDIAETSRARVARNVRSVERCTRTLPAVAIAEECMSCVRSHRLLHLEMVSVMHRSVIPSVSIVRRA